MTFVRFMRPSLPRPAEADAGLFGNRLDLSNRARRSAAARSPDHGSLLPHGASSMTLHRAKNDGPRSSEALSRLGISEWLREGCAGTLSDALRIAYGWLSSAREIHGLPDERALKGAEATLVS